MSCQGIIVLNKINIFAHTNGFVAQLYRAPHYGCGGLRLESLRGHKKNPAPKCWVFPFKAIKVYFEKQFKRKNLKTAKQFGFYAWNAHYALDHEIILTRSQSKLKVPFHIGLGLFYCSPSGEHEGIIGVFPFNLLYFEKKLKVRTMIGLIKHFSQINKFITCF